MTSRKRIPVLVPEPQISLREIEDYVRDVFVREFGREAIKQISVGKYPDEYGVLITVDKRHSKMSQLSDEIERQFEEKGIEVGIGVSTI